MAKLYLLRFGSGNKRVASSFNVDFEKIKDVYEDSLVVTSVSLPIVNGDTPANPISNHNVAVIELFEGEESFGNFKSPGFNMLSGVKSSDVCKCLLEPINSK